MRIAKRKESRKIRLHCGLVDGLSVGDPRIDLELSTHARAPDSCELRGPWQVLSPQTSSASRASFLKLPARVNHTGKNSS